MSEITVALGWLKNAIEKYLQVRPDERPDGVGICAYFRTPIDMIYIALQELETENRIIRHEDPQGTWYQAVRREETKPAPQSLDTRKRRPS